MTESTTSTERRSPLGLPFLALLGLAALAVPRVILHDLHVIEEGDLATWLLALLPVAVWITVAVVARVPNPFLTVFVIGALFGGMLMLTHQLLWSVNFGGDAPDLGGPVGTVLPRVAVVFSSVFTGAIMGTIAGLIAWGVSALVSRRR